MRKQHAVLWVAVAFALLGVWLPHPALAAGDETVENSWRFEEGEPVLPADDGMQSDGSVHPEAADSEDATAASEEPLAAYAARAAGTLWTKNGTTWSAMHGGSLMTVTDAKRFGVDVSEHNGTINWQAAKNAGVDFAIIRCGYVGKEYAGFWLDDQWVNNVKGARAAGVRIGVYIYSYGSTVDRASREADFVIYAMQQAGISAKDLAYPVFYDLEESSLESTSNRKLFADMMSTFKNKLAAQGYTVGVYANRNWFDNYLTEPIFSAVPRWVAAYPLRGTQNACILAANGSRWTKPYDMWQCMSTGQVAGIGGSVDIDFDYRAYDLSSCVGPAGSMFRLYNPYTGEHFYTADASEGDHLISVGWRYEGVGWTAPASSKTPVYRLYNKYVKGGDHHYTTDKAEYDRLVKAGWTGEGVRWYSDDAKGVPVYRQYNPYAVTGTHNFTTDSAENDTLVSKGWRAEGVAWYGKE